MKTTQNKKMENTSILKISIFNGIIRFLDFSLRFFLGIYLAGINFSGLEIGIIFAVSTMTNILTILPSGLSNDKFRSKDLIAIALICSVMFYFGISQTESFPIIVILFFMGGFGSTLYQTSTDSLFYKSTNKEEVSKKISIYHSLSYIFTGTGMMATGLLLSINIEFKDLFFAVGATYAIMAIISQLILPKNEKATFKILHYKKDIFKKEVIFFLVMYFIFALHFGAETTSYGLFLKKYLGLSSLYTGLYMGTGAAFMSCIVIALGNNPKWKVKYILILGLFLSGIGHIFMTIKDPILSLGFRIIHESGDAMTMFFIVFGIAKLFDLKRIGGNSSIFALISTLGAATGAVMFGPIGAAYGYQIPLIISGITSLFAMILSVKFITLIDHR